MIIKTTKDFHDLFMNLDQDRFEEFFFNGNEGKKWVEYNKVKYFVSGLRTLGDEISDLDSTTCYKIADWLEKVLYLDEEEKK